MPRLPENLRLLEKMEMLDYMPVPVSVLGADEKIVFLNRHARALPGMLDRSGTLPATLAELEQRICLYHPDAASPFAEPIPGPRHPIRLALRGESTAAAEFLVRRSDAGSYWLECDAEPLRDALGEIDGAVLTCRDITERRRREQSLESRMRVQQFVYNENLAGILHTTFDGRILHVNDAIVRMLSYGSREELLGLRAPRLYHDPSERDGLLTRLSAGARLDEVEMRFRCKDGSLKWGLMNVRLIDAGANEIGDTIISSVLDITERKASEETLRQSEQRFSAFMRNLPGVAFIKDLKGRYIYYNDASYRLFGIVPDDIIGKTDAEVWPVENATTYRGNDARVVEASQPVEIVEQVPHGRSTHSWLINKFPIVESGGVVAVGGVGIDITERLHLEDQLTQARKMEALGRLAGGIAHDFNNLLTVISGYSQLALEGIETAPVERLSAYVQEVLNSSRRAAGLTNQLLAFSRRQNVQPKVHDLGELLRNMERMLQRVIGEHVDLHVRCDAIPCLVRADSHQLETVVINLSANARDAMPLGGILDIECSVLPGTVDEREVMLLVRDTGIGMDEGTRSRLFEPFFTSKEKGKGTGLGLSTVYGIVTQAGGRIEVESEPGEGASFRIYLPLSLGETVQQGVLPPTSQPLSGTETILLVEDELSVRELAREILKRLGYKVLVADSGKSALEIWDLQFGKIDLLLTDVIMPQMSGGELAHRLRDRNPRLRVLFMSGYTDDMIASHGSLDAGTQLLPKPFTAEALGRKLRELLEA